METNECHQCSEMGLGFSRLYSPEESIVGDPESPVWIVGLNPKQEGPSNDAWTSRELRGYFSSPQRHRYFDDFEKVSEVLSARLGTERGVAHVDLVK